MWNGLERNTAERRKGCENTKGINEGVTEGEGLRYELHHYPLNFNGRITRYILFICPCVMQQNTTLQAL
jgi:hypothetical protein